MTETEPPTTPSRQNWAALIGGAVVIIGMLMVWLNLTGSAMTPSPTSTPIIVRDGLIVRGSGPELYIFEAYTLRQLANPTEAQRARAQPVPDQFLAQYLPSTAPPQPAAAYLWGIAGGIGSLVGGIWLWRRQHQRRPAGNEPYLTASLQQAALYLDKIERLLRANPGLQSGHHLLHLRQWQQTLQGLAQSLAEWRQHSLIDHELATLPAVIANLERQLAAESDPALRAQLTQTLAQRHQQRLALETWQTTVRQAEIQFETTIALLGTLYSHLLTHTSTIHVADYQRLTHSLDEEVGRLQDYLEAWREVKGSH